MYLLPYETTAMQRLYKGVTTQITNKIRRAELDMKLPAMETPGNHKLTNAVFVTPSREHEDIPRFTQYVNMGNAKDPLLACDARMYMTLEEKSGTYRLVATNDWKLQCVRMALNNALILSPENPFARMSDFPMRLFCRWIPALLDNKYHLRPDSIMAMQVITAYYYLAMSYPDLRTPGDTRYQDMGRVADVTGVPLRDVKEVMERLGDLKNVQDLATALSKHGNTMQLGELSDTALIILVGTSWFGVSGRENIQIALEHMPTWISIVFGAVDDRSYKKTSLAVRAETAAFRREKETFVENVLLTVDKFYA